MASHIIGYSSIIYGSTGIEGTYADTLAGRADFNSWTDAFNVLASKQVPGNDVYLTIDSRIQAAAERVLVGEVGGVVVIDAKSGAILAMSSSPTYDNNMFEEMLASSGDDGSGSGGGETMFFNRATQGLYAPGSTFKIVTLASALSKGGIKLDSTYDSPQSIEIGGANITNFDATAHGNVTLLRAFELSSNTVFAQLADEIGASQLCKTAGDFGFNKKLDLDFTLSTSLMPDPRQMTKWETAWAGVGQPVGEHSSPAGPQATVLQMCMVGAAIANDGVLMTPYLFDYVVSPQGAVGKTTAPRQLAQACPASVAREISRAMEEVVTQGTGTAAQIGGYTIRGKTGTAETNKPRDNSWFVGYVEVGGRIVVVAIVIEQSDGAVATPKAREVLLAAIEAFG